jgi:hypothetical protein
MASAMISPIELVELAEMVPTWAMALVSVQGMDSLLDLFDGGLHGLVDAALQVHRVHAGGNRLQAFVDRMAWASTVAVVVPSPATSVGLGSHFLDHLGAHVLELVFQFDFLRHGHAVLGDGRSAEGFVEHHVAAFRAEGDFDGVGQDVHAFEHFLRAESPNFTSLASGGGERLFNPFEPHRAVVAAQAGGLDAQACSPVESPTAPPTADCRIREQPLLVF